jgi:hypothetical protein
VAYIREDQADISVSLNGAPKGDAWGGAEGGNLEAPGSKTRPGGMGNEVSVGSQPSRTDATIEIDFDDIVAGWHADFENNVGHGRVDVGFAWLGPNKVPTGKTHARTGTRTAARLPNFNATGSAVGRYQIVVECDQQAA